MAHRTKLPHFAVSCSEFLIRQEIRCSLHHSLYLYPTEPSIQLIPYMQNTVQAWQQSLHVCTYRHLWHNKVYMSVRTATYGTTKSKCLYMPLYMAQPFWIICTSSNYPEDRTHNENSASDTHVCHFCLRLLLAAFFFPIHI